MITTQNRNNGGQRAAHYGSGIISPKLWCHNIFETDKDQLKGKWDKETWGGVREGERERKKKRTEGKWERERVRERASSACWTLTACEASIIHAAVHMSRARRQAQQQGRAQIKQRIRGQCPQCTWRNTPRPISLLFSDKQRTSLPEHCLILLKSQEMLKQSLFVCFFPPYFIYLPLFLAEMLVPVGSIFSWLISPLFRSLYFSETAIMPLVLFKSTASLCWSPTCLH